MGPSGLDVGQGDLLGQHLVGQCCPQGRRRGQGYTGDRQPKTFVFVPAPAPLVRICHTRSPPVRVGWDLRFAKRLVDGYRSNMKAARPILHRRSVLFLSLKFLPLGLALLFFSGLIFDYSDVSLGHRRTDLTL